MATFYHPVMAIFIIKIVRITKKWKKKMEREREGGGRVREREGGREGGRERGGGGRVCVRERERERGEDKYRSHPCM